MAEEFDHSGVCGGSNWRSLPRNLFNSSPCSSATNETGSFGWRSSHNLNMNVKTTRSSDNSDGSVSDGSPTILRDAQKFQQQTTADDWNQDLQSEENYSQIVQASGALNSSMNYRHQTRGIDDYCNEIDNSNSKINICGDFSVNVFKRDSLISFSTQQQPSASIIECTETCQGLSTNFPLNSASYGYTSTLLRTLIDTDSDHSQQTFCDNQEMNYLSATNLSDELMSGFSKASPLQIKPSLAKQQPANRLQYSNNTPLSNATAPPDFIPSTPSKYLTTGLNNFPNTSHDQKRGKEESKNLASVAKKSNRNEPALKHPRLETPSPSPSPTLKVRKAKLGDRITALQQLVSPFGKTDTASVLHEVIEYIKFFHDQVNVLSTPYLKNGSPPLKHQPDQEGLKQDLSSRGLCLVPVSIIFLVAADNTSDFWTPTFGRSSVDIEDLTIKILEGLDDDYKELAIAIQARETSISSEELHEKLLNHEAYLAAKKDTHIHLPITANTAARAATSHRSHYRAPSQSPSTHFRPPGAWTPRSSQPSTQRTLRPYLGSCQLCEEQGHSAKRCPNLKHISWPNSASSQPPAKLSYAGPHANAANHTSSSSDWILDSGATHHVTIDLANLSLHSPYVGTEDVVVGNGTGLQITHTGSLSPPCHPSFLKFSNACVSSMHKKLLSVSQLCTTSNVIVVFTSNHFQVKDYLTGTILHQGPLKDGIYSWSSSLGTSTSPLAFPLSDVLFLMA